MNLKYLSLIISVCLAFLLSAAGSSAAPRQGEELPVNITLKVKWDDCFHNCDNKKTGNMVKSGSLSVNIYGHVVLRKESFETLIYEPKSLKASYNIQSETKAVQGPCAKCPAPYEKYSGSGTVALGKKGEAMAFLQGLMGKTGAVFAMQLAGNLTIDKMMALTKLQKQDIFSFMATVPMQVKLERIGDCKKCTADAPETLPITIGIPLNVDMIKKKTGFRKWQSDNDPLSDPGATLTDAAGIKIVGPEEKPGTAKYSMNWSIGEVKPSDLKITKIYFNYDGNKDSAVTLKKHRDDSEIKAPEWTGDGENKPAAFTREAKFKVKALFKTEGRIEKAEIWAEEENLKDPMAKVPGGFKGIEKKMVTFKDGEKEKEVEFNIKSAPPVVSVNSVRWRWFANIWYKGVSEADEEVAIKTSEPLEKEYTDHTIYIVGGQPQTKNTYEFVVKKGCAWAEGTKGGDETFEPIWESFRDIGCPEDTNCNGNPMPGIMAYMHGTAPAFILGLLREGRGTCGGWQEFFTAVAGAQGIKVDEQTICPKTEQDIDSMVVRSGAAQGNVAPARLFKNHAVNLYNKKIYDPSYHTVVPVGPAEKVSIYENESFSAYCVSKPYPDVSMCSAFEASYNDWVKCIEDKCPSCRKNNPLDCEVFLAPGKCPKKKKDDKTKQE